MSQHWQHESERLAATSFSDANHIAAAHDDRNRLGLNREWSCVLLLSKHSKNLLREPALEPRLQWSRALDPAYFNVAHLLSVLCNLCFAHSLDLL